MDRRSIGRSYRHPELGVITPGVIWGCYSNQMDEPQAHKYNFILIGIHDKIDLWKDALVEISVPVDDFNFTRLLPFRASGLFQRGMTFRTRCEPNYVSERAVRRGNSNFLRFPDLDGNPNVDLSAMIRKFNKSLRQVS